MPNTIPLECPTCSFSHSDVLAIITVDGVKKVAYRCLRTDGKRHSFQKTLTADLQYQAFFQSAAYE